MAWQVYTAAGAIKTALQSVTSADITAALTTPPAIGATTPNTGKFTSLEATSLFVAASGSINAAAASQVDSTTQGQLPPRMTTTQRDAISSPPNGLHIYDSTLHRPSSYLNGAWYPHSSFDIKPRTVLGANATSVTISLPATFNEARIRIEFRTDYGTGTVDSLLMQCNSDTTAGNYYTQGGIVANATFTGVEYLGTNAGITLPFCAPCNTATAGNNTMYVTISNYQSSTLRRGVWFNGSVQRAASSGNISVVWGEGWWQNTSAAITQVVFKPLNGTNIVSGSAYSVEGIW